MLRLSPFTIHRETVRLAMLIAVTGVTFMLVRELAQVRRRTELDDAVAWQQIGAQALADSDVARAATAFRRATLKEPGNTTHVLTLADALLQAGNGDAAARALLRVREVAPEDPFVNRALARVEASRNDVPKAVRYYHHALYGSWPSADGPREIRLELIRLLLDRRDLKKAVAELVAATTDLPATPSSHLVLAKLFAEAGDWRHALEHFTTALAMSPGNTEATEGAIQSAFATGDYKRAASYALPKGAGAEARQLAAVAGLITTNDPLAVGVRAATRRRRLLFLVDRVHERQRLCAAVPDAGVAAAITEIAALHLDRAAADREPDALEAGMQLVGTATRLLDPVCTAAPIDLAIGVLARYHGLEP